MTKVLPNLNPLRFFLALFVIIYHITQLCESQQLPFYNSQPIFFKGPEAVYMFFVLSGFLIIRKIYKSKSSGKFSIKFFYLSRALRILPLYYLIVIFAFIYYNILLPFFNIPFEINYDIKTGLLMTILFVPNVFASYNPGGLFEILWSIGIEEQFYLSIAPLLFFLKRKYILKVLTLIFLLYIIIFHLKEFEFLRTYKSVYFFLISGGIISILEEKNKLNFLKKNKILSIIVALLTLLFFFTDIFDFENLFLYNLFICILFSLFVHVISFGNFNVEIRNIVLNYLGKISYGIYMYHVIALNFVVFLFLKIYRLNIFSDFMIIILIHILTIILTALISHLSYKYFESYFLKLKKNIVK